MLLFSQGNGRYCDRHGCVTPVTVTDKMTQIFHMYFGCIWLDKYVNDWNHLFIYCFCNLWLPFFLDICHLFEKQLCVAVMDVTHLSQWRALPVCHGNMCYSSNIKANFNRLFNQACKYFMITGSRSKWLQRRVTIFFLLEVPSTLYVI